MSQPRARHHHKGSGPSARPNFGGSLLFMRTPFVAELPRDGAYVSWGQPRLLSQERNSRDHFGGSSVFMPIPTSFNAERPWY